MTNLLLASEVTLGDLREKFHLTWSKNNQFFTEWLDELPPLTEAEKSILDRVKSNFLGQLEWRLTIEETVKLVVLSPLLDLAGFYRQPFRIESEVPVRLEIPDQDTEEIIQGRMDTLIVQGQLWILVVESKRTQLSIQTGIPQILAYMLATPNRDRPTFGLVTNGSEFTFAKLAPQSTPEFDLSDLFSILNRGNDLHRVLQVLRGIGGLIRGDR